MNDHENNLIRYELIRKDSLSKDNFFEDLFMQCYDNKIIDDALAEKINDDRLKNLQILLKYFTKNESSSVAIETAESILKSVDYTIGMYLKQFETIEEMIERLKSEDIESMLKKGNRIIKLNVEYSKRLLNKVKMTKLKVGNYSYDDTIDIGIDKFFKTYDDFFCAQGGDCDIDYQLAIDIGDYLGVEYIRYYLERLNVENQFCHNFRDENIKKLLYGYDKKSELLLLNIFEIVLTNSIGLMICGKDIHTLNITEIDRDIIYDYLKDLSNDELNESLTNVCKEIVNALCINDESLICYINECSNTISEHIYKGIKIHNLNNIFISFREEEEQIIEYIDKEKLSNKKFRYITELIRNTPHINEKINIINSNIKSLIDLNDMLDAECLFDIEYDEFFMSLSKMNIVLLAKYIEENENKQDWHDKFCDFIDKMSEDDKANMLKLKEKIVLS
ncbi:MAG: DUF6179 domain-containing protein [Clostridium sp.]|nr:DUF6179 domain-containing protein [Clostridium sp.]